MVKWLLVVFTIIAIGLAVFFATFYKEDGPNDQPETILGLSTNNLNPQAGQQFDVSANINTNANTISELRVSIEIAPEIAEVDTVTPGADFEIVQGSLVINPQSVVFRARAKQTGFQGSAVIATMKFRGITQGDFNLVYGDSTIVGAASESQHNVLRSTSGLSIMISDN